MARQSASRILRGFRVSGIIPALMAIALFASLRFFVVLPHIRHNILERKHETIKELARSAVSGLASFHARESAGEMTRQQAQDAAADYLRSLRYGPEDKDYYWIITGDYWVVMNPYRRDLEGRDVSDYIGPDGTNFFRDIVSAVEADGFGYVEYLWQWQDDPNRFERKVSYAVHFKPWNWIVGTGLYLDDAQVEITALTRNITMMSLAIVLVTAVLVFVTVAQSLKAQRARSSAQETLEESERRYEGLIETMNEGLGVLDADLKMTLVNKRTTEILGYEREELIGRAVTDFLTEEGARQLAEQVALPETGQMRRFDLEWRGKDGRIISTLVSPQPILDEAGNFIGGVGVVVDITERKKAQEALHESQRMLETLMGNLPGMAYRCRNDRDWTMEFVSQGCRELTGYDTEALLLNRDLSYNDVIHPDDRERIWAEVQDALGRRKSFQLLYRINDASGEEKWVWEQGIGVFDDGGGLLALEGFITDITERVKAEKSLAEHRDHLEELVRGRTRELWATTGRLEESLEKLKKDEEAGKRIQFRLLPEKRRVFGDYEFQHRLIPSMYASGDFVDCFEIDEARVGFYMADVSGHGVSSAFVTVFLKSFMTNALENFRNTGTQLVVEPEALLQKLNSDLMRENLGKHVCIFYGVLDKRENRLIFSSAGQFPFPLFRSDGGVEAVDVSAKPAGLFESATYSRFERDLPPCFALALFSDGILEILPQVSLAGKLDYLESLVEGSGFDLESILDEVGIGPTQAPPDDVALFFVRRGNCDE